MPNVPGVADHGVPPAPFVQRARKFLAALAGTAAMVVATKVLEEDVEVWVNLFLAACTAAGVYVVPNKRENLHDDTLRA